MLGPHIWESTPSRATCQRNASTARQLVVQMASPPPALSWLSNNLQKVPLNKWTPEGHGCFSRKIINYLTQCQGNHWEMKIGLVDGLFWNPPSTRRQKNTTKPEPSSPHGRGVRVGNAPSSLRQGDHVDLEWLRSSAVNDAEGSGRTSTGGWGSGSKALSHWSPSGSPQTLKWNE